MKRQKNKLIGTALVIVVILAGLLYARYSWWWFTPVHSQRQIVSQFFDDLTKGKSQAAYQLTSSDFQHNISFANFETNFNMLTGQKIGMKFNSYTDDKNSIGITGVTTDSADSLKIDFGANIIQQNQKNKIDVLVLRYVNST